ncbi:MAG: hypothetical protein CL610_12695 [Anaerolineaceae bacterium]|nr:hypothetical protein [Anaerolineaceae bacterium]
MNSSNLIFLPEDHNANQSYIEIIMSRLGGFIQTKDTYYGRLYRVHDWVYVLSESKAKDRRKPWNELKAMLMHHHLINDGEIISVGDVDSIRNKDVTSDFVIEEMLYFIVQYMTFNDSVTAVRNYLAKAGVFVDTIRKNPETGLDAARAAYRMQGKDDAWIDTRLEGIINRKKFTNALRVAVRFTLEKREYGTATNDLYIGLWKRTRAILLDQMDLPKNANLRDNQSRLALLLEGVAEEVCAVHLGNEKELSWMMARAVIQEAAAKIGKYADELERDLGIDIATNIPLNPGHELPKLDGSGQEIEDWKNPRKIASQND